jgi:putative flavoprotein involved in K+ transport
LRSSPASRFTETGVVFTDNSAADYDAVLLGTGYRAAIDDFLEADGVLDRDGTPLVSGGPAAQPGPWFCGFKVVSGGTLGLIRAEAPEIARQIAS